MAYITQEQKKIISSALKIILNDYPTVKATLSIRDHNTIVCTISKGPEYLTPANGTDESVNHFHIDKCYKNNPDAAKLLTSINKCLHIGHEDNSDTQRDYYDTSWYVRIEIGKWNKPFIVA